MGFVFWAPGMVSAMDMTVVLLCRAVRLKGVPEVNVMVLGSQGSSRKALSLNLRCHRLTLRGGDLDCCTSAQCSLCRLHAFRRHAGPQTGAKRQEILNGHSTAQCRLRSLHAFQVHTGPAGGVKARGYDRM